MTPGQIEDYVDAAAAALELPLDAAHRPGVLQYLALAAGFADIVNAVPLSPHDDCALGFLPAGPEPAEGES